MKRLRFLIALTAVLAAALPLSAAGSKEELPKEINVSFVEAPFNLQIMVMKEKGLLEKAFKEKGVAVKWHYITSGAHQTQAMAAGSLDIASVVNTTSVILANAAGNRVEIAGLVSRPKRTFALLTGPQGPSAIKDLKGKTVAGPKGTVLHQMLAAALTAEGLSMKDVDFISMGLPEARTALLSGKIDAALQAGSLIIRGMEAGLKVLFTADGFVTPILVTAVRPEFAKKYPDLLALYLKVQEDAYAWILGNLKEAVAIGSKIQKISETDGMQLYEWSGMASDFEDKDLDSMREDVKFLLEQNMIANSVNPADFVLPAAFKKK